MTHNLCATVFVYRHRETGTITALYSDDACAMNYRPDYEHVATLEPRTWIEHHFDDAINEREACAKLCDNEKPANPWKPVSAHLEGQFEMAGHLAELIRARGNQ